MLEREDNSTKNRVSLTDENDSNTPLHRAVKDLDIKTVKRLLKEGANLEATNDAGVTPLQMAASTPNSFPLFELLLKEGANLYAADQNGNTVLHAAAAAIDNSLVIEKILAENPSFHKIKNHLGDTPLHVAVNVHNDISINKLLQLNADPQAKNKSGQIPFPQKKVINSDTNEASKEQNNTPMVEISPQPLLSHFSKQLPVSLASLKNLEERLLAKRSRGEAFVDWVHENPGWSIAIAIGFCWVLLVPPIAMIVAALSDSSKKPIKNFINEFAVASINGEVNTWDNRILERAAINLPNQQIIDIAFAQIRESNQSLQNPKLEQENQIKEMLLKVLDNAPASFSWNKKQLAELLRVEGKNGELFLTFTVTYEVLKEGYDRKAEDRWRNKTKFFANFIQTVFGVFVEFEEKEVSAYGMVEKRGADFACSVKVSDIEGAQINVELLQRYYAAFEVRAVLRKAIEECAGQDEANKLLAQSIRDNLKVRIDTDNLAFIVWCDFVDNEDKLDWGVDKAEELEKTQNLFVNNLKDYLNKFYGEESFKLMVSKSGSNSKPVIEFEVPEESFQTILERKREETHLESAIFPPVFHPDKQRRQNAYLSEEHQQINQFSKLLVTIFERNLNYPLIKNNLDFLKNRSLQSVTKDNVEYFELYSASAACSPEQLATDQYPLNLFESVQSLVNEYFGQFPCAQVLDLDVDENSQPLQFKLLVRKDRFNHLLEWSEKKEEAEKMRDFLNTNYKRKFVLSTLKNHDKYPDGTLFLAEQIKGKDEGNRNMLAGKAAFEVNASLSNKQPMPEQLVTAESRGHGDSHCAFVCVYPNKFPKILEIMKANDLNFSL